MGKNALGKLFNRLCFFLAALPLAVIALIFYQCAERPGIERLAIPVLGWVVWFVIESIRYIASGEYEMDKRLRKISQ